MIITLRFVADDTAISSAIRLREGNPNTKVFPFMPSHVEMVYPGGYLGAHIGLGFVVRPVGYDASASMKEHFINVQVPDEEAALAWAKSKIGTPYDWEAILDYVMPVNFHGKDDMICSASMTMLLQNGLYLPPLPQAPHNVSPRDLLMMLYAKGEK